MIDRAYLEATVANCRQQEREGQQLADRAAGARMLCEALLAKLAEDEVARPENEKEPEPEG